MHGTDAGSMRVSVKLDRLGPFHKEIVVQIGTKCVFVVTDRLYFGVFSRFYSHQSVFKIEDVKNTPYT